MSYKNNKMGFVIPSENKNHKKGTKGRKPSKYSRPCRGLINLNDYFELDFE